MNVFTDISQLQRNKNTIITIGTFDGFHLGHKGIADKLQEVASVRGGRSLLITFEPHPRSVVSKNYNMKLLTTLEEKIEILSGTGLENILVVNFTAEFASLTPEQFFEDMIVRNIGVSELVIGHDHRLGKNRDGDENKLKQLGHIFSFGVHPVEAVRLDGETVSSTRVRHLLEEGNVERASAMLGRDYSFSGTVVKGAQRGRTMGFPTANVQPDNPMKLIPARGVYLVEFILHPESESGVNAATGTESVKVHSGSEDGRQKYFGVMNIGLRPTFGDVVEQVNEAYLFGFDGDIYSRKVTVRFLRHLREEKKFGSIDELVRQIEADKNLAVSMLRQSGLAI